MRVLVAEDESAAGIAMAKYLGLQGHEVQIAVDGHAALEKARTCKPDVLIADWRLGHEMDGVQLARELQRRWPGLPTILISAYPVANVRAAARDLDNTSILPKPLELSELARTVAAAGGH